MSIFRNDPSDYGPFKQLHAKQEPAERVVWRFMCKHQEEHHGIPPTLAEIAETLPNQHRSSAKHLVEKLVEAGWVKEIAEEGKSHRYLAVNVPTGDYEMSDEIFTRIIPATEL